MIIWSVLAEAGDAYDEDAINHALHRLAVRQQQRQYAANRGISSLGNNDPPADQKPPLAKPPPKPTPSESCDEKQLSSKPSAQQKNANETFNNFVRDSFYDADLPNSSREYAISQQSKQQRMSEQSRALLEHNKAKHQAMVAQAHAAAKSQPKTQPPITFHTAGIPHNYHMTHSVKSMPDEEDDSSELLAPKPPPKPSSDRKPASAHRMAR